MNSLIKFFLFQLLLLVVILGIVFGLIYLRNLEEIKVNEPEPDYKEKCLENISIFNIVEFENFRDPNEASSFLVDKGFAPPSNLTKGSIDIFLYENHYGLKEFRVCLNGEGL